MIASGFTDSCKLVNAITNKSLTKNTVYEDNLGIS